MTELRKYPWLRLLELELTQPRPEPKRKRGRPKSRFTRSRLSARMTTDELNALDELVDLLRLRFGRSVHRGHVIAFMTFQLRSRLQAEGRKVDLPKDIDSFVRLAELLDK